MQIGTRVSAILAFSLAIMSPGCAQTPAFGARNIIESSGFRLQVNWCEVKADRSAECELTATSLTQDYLAGFSYPILQDQTGAQFRMVPKDGGLGRYTMIAGEPYTIRYVNKEILPTTVERVRGLVGSWTFWTLNRIKAGEFSVTFSDIPVRPAAPAPIAETEPDADPQTAPATEPADDVWETIGLWTYNAQEGLRVPEGFVLKDAPGASGGHSWTHRLELKAHAELPPRADRIVWPVYLSRSEKQVCVDAPYPSFSGYIDMPDDTNDGVYAFASCKGGAAN